VSCALDVLGERWTLLIVRNLLVGPQRYTDLAAQLPGMASNLLGARLRDLEAVGVVTRRFLEPPAARTVYELTDRGRELEPVICALGRWGAPLLAGSDSLAYQPHLVTLGLKTQLRLEALPAGPLHFAVALDVGTWAVEILDAQASDGASRSPTDRVVLVPVDEVPAEARAVVRASARALMERRADEIRFEGDPDTCATVRALVGVPAVGGRPERVRS
jgi:DNA-binding HxlR family transcriptional regulator